MNTGETQRDEIPLYRKRWVILALSALTILFISVYMISKQLNRLAETTLLDLINSELQPNAELTIGEFNLSIFRQRVSARDIELIHSRPYDELQVNKPFDTIRKLRADQITIHDLQLFRMLRERELSIGQFTIDHLSVEVVPTTDRIPAQSSPFRIPADLTIHQVQILNSELSAFPDATSDQPKWNLHGLNLTVNNFTISDPDIPLYLMAGDFSIHADSVMLISDNQHYQLKSERITADSHISHFSTGKTILQPLMDVSEMARKRGYETDRYHLSAGGTEIFGIDFHKWLKQRDIVANLIRLDDFQIHIDRDKSYDKEPRDERLLPHARLANLPFTVSVDSLHWNNGSIRYTELFPDEERSGTVFFDNLDIYLNNIQNQDSSDYITAQASASFLGAVNFEAGFSFLPDGSGYHSLWGRLGSADFNAFNDPLNSLAFINLNRGVLHSLEFGFTADHDASTGTMKMIYDDLEVRFLDNSTLDEGRRTRLRSFFVNQFAVRSSNDSESPRVVDISYERDKSRSMFNYWWNTVKDGLRKSASR